MLSVPPLNGAPLALFSFLRRIRTFHFRARAGDGTMHEFEIQASTAQIALDLATRLCAAKDWKLVSAQEA